MIFCKDEVVPQTADSDVEQDIILQCPTSFDCVTKSRVSQGDSLLRGAGSARGRGRGRGYSVSTAAGNVVRVREKPVAVDFDKVTWTLHKLN